jgi:hypothetical protein
MMCKDLSTTYGNVNANFGLLLPADVLLTYNEKSRGFKFSVKRVAVSSPAYYAGLIFNQFRSTYLEYIWNLNISGYNDLHLTAAADTFSFCRDPTCT